MGLVSKKSLLPGRNAWEICLELHTHVICGSWHQLMHRPVSRHGVSQDRLLLYRLATDHRLVSMFSVSRVGL